MPSTACEPWAVLALKIILHWLVPGHPKLRPFTLAITVPLRQVAALAQQPATAPLFRSGSSSTQARSSEEWKLTFPPRRLPALRIASTHPRRFGADRGRLAGRGPPFQDRPGSKASGRHSGGHPAQACPCCYRMEGGGRHYRGTTVTGHRSPRQRTDQGVERPVNAHWATRTRSAPAARRLHHVGCQSGARLRVSKQFTWTRCIRRDGTPDRPWSLR